VRYNGPFLPQTGVFNPFAPAENQEQFDGSRASFYRDCPYLSAIRLKDPVQRRQAWSFGTTAQHEQLVSQGQNLQEQVPAGFQPGNRQVKRECQPTNHVAEDLWKHRRNPVFSAWMRFLPVTAERNASDNSPRATEH
jgi:hypothetical protein